VRFAPAAIAFAIVFGEADPSAMLWHLRDLPFAAETAPLQLSILQ
jgi:hypothetical protein